MGLREQGLRASGRFDKVHSLAVQMIQEHAKIIDFGCLTNPAGFVQSQQEVGGEVFI